MTDSADETLLVAANERSLAPDTLPVPSTINGRYELSELLGEGGMGVVYRATDALRGTEIALKMLRGETLSTPSLALFKAEFMTLGTLQHPNIARVFDFAQRQGSADFFFTMELVSGSNALDATEGASVETILQLALQVLRALAYLHTRNVIHLDLKPANILVTAEGGVRVLDFGIAHSAHSQHLGRYATPLFMAPELSLEGAEVDRRADIYSFGVTLFQLLFRRMPVESVTLDFAGAEEQRFLLRPEEVARVPRWLPGILRRSVARDPADRFRSANEVIAAINEASGGNVAFETEQTRDSYVASATLVGQKDVLESVLARLHERMRSGRDDAIIFLCTGPSGSGKSRIQREVRQRCQIAQHLLIDAQCYGESLGPYAVWDGIVTQVASLLAPELAAHGAVLEALAPGLAARLGLAARSQPLDASELAKGLLDLLLALGRPCILSIDDLQWIDLASLELLELLVERIALLERARSLRLAFLCSARDGASEEIAQTLHRLRSAKTVFDAVLRPLDASQVGELVASMLGTTDLAPALSAGLAAATGGNALLVSEVMHAWVKDGSLSPRASGWTFQRPRTAAEIASELTHLLSDRLAELAPAQLSALRVLSVFGRPLDLDLLERVLESDRETVAALVGELRQKHFVFLSRGQLHFSAARWNSVVDEGISAAERAALHRRLAELIAPSAAAALVAFHYERGESPELAATWYGRAALHSFQRGDLKHALAHAEKAVAIGADGREFGLVCGAAAEAARLLGNARAVYFAARALALLPQGSPEWMQASRVAIATFSPRFSPS